MNKVYEDKSEERLADLAIVFHDALLHWKNRHPEYDFEMSLSNNKLTLKVTKHEQ